MTQIIVLVMLWEISIILAAIGGFFVGRKVVTKRKKMATEPILTEEQKRQAEQEKRENDFFESYRGIPQWNTQNDRS